MGFAKVDRSANISVILRFGMNYSMIIWIRFRFTDDVLSVDK